MKKLSVIMSALILAAAASIGVDAADMYVEKELTPIVSVEAPTGGGSKDLGVINDGVLEGDDKAQYDTYCGRTEAAEDFIGYTFAKPYTVKELVFTEGNHFNNGGWFEMGMVRIEVLKDGEWQEVEAVSDPEYPSVLTQDEAGEPFEQFKFTFDAVECDGIRIIGMAGGAASFISCAELQVLAEVADDYVVFDAKAAAAAAEFEARYQAETAEGYININFTPFTNITEPKGGGNKDINVINDGEWNVEGDGKSALQYDTYIAATDYQEIIFGYEFDGKTYSVTQVDFHEGLQFGDGGWFSNGIKVQALIGTEWVDVNAVCTPEYPVSDVPEDHLPEAQCFSFTFDPVDCLGIRIIGNSSGLGFFTSISELRVKGTEASAAATETAPVETAPATAETEPEAPAADPETVEAAAPAETEPAAETVPAVEPETVAVTAPASDSSPKAPQTFDAVSISAAAALTSLLAAGAANISKKRK